MSNWNKYEKPQIPSTQQGYLFNSQCSALYLLWPCFPKLRNGGNKQLHRVHYLSVHLVLAIHVQCRVLGLCFTIRNMFTYLFYCKWRTLFLQERSTLADWVWAQTTTLHIRYRPNLLLIQPPYPTHHYITNSNSQFLPLPTVIVHQLPMSQWTSRKFKQETSFSDSKNNRLGFSHL